MTPIKPFKELLLPVFLSSYNHKLVCKVHTTWKRDDVEYKKKKINSLQTQARVSVDNFAGHSKQLSSQSAKIILNDFSKKIKALFDEET